MKNQDISKHCYEIRLRAVKLFGEGLGYKFIASHLNVSKSVVREWFYIYQAFGYKELLKMESTRSNYTFEQKLDAVQAIVDNGMTKQEAMKTFKIKSLTSLKRWCKKYKEGGKEALRSKNKGRPKGSKSRQKSLTREEELEEKVRYLETEVAYLKKLRALVEKENL